MDDYDLWYQLRGTTALRPELPKLLRELAGLTVAQRLAFLGELERHPQLQSDVGVRAAAVACLAGCHGILAWQHLVAGLNAPVTEVQLAALQALHRSAAYDQGRWVHALYHPSPTVRARAAALGPLPEPGTETLPPQPAPRADIATILGSSQVREVDSRALTDYLHEGTGVNFDQRLQAAKALASRSYRDFSFPVWFQAPPGDAQLVDFLAGVPPDLLHAATCAVLLLGSADHENLLVKAFDKRARAAEDEESLALLLTHATQLSVRRWARERVPASPLRDWKLVRLATVFSWGVDVGRILTGEKFDVRLLVGEQDMGYTRLKQNKIFITGKPILRGERQGSAVVRGLIVHEYGHHMYHKGPEAEAVDQECTKEKLQALYNLVQDEHLERNLRRGSPRYGDLLKTLAAYAFQHSKREVAAAALLEHLGPRAAEVLPRIPLGAARKAGHVVVSSGRLMRSLEDAGHSFARFVRALRTGLGNRHGDPKVDEGLALFKTGFRKSSMPQLLDIARKLRDIFGDETNILQQLSQDTLLSEDEAGVLDNDGISADQLQQAVDDLQPGRKREGMPGGFDVNRGPEEKFDPITRVEKLTPDPAEHRKLAERVAGPARQLRRYFEELGLVQRPQKRRLQGRTLDRGRVRDLVIKRDPRVLVARHCERSTDLFIGVAIDCSGSMGGAKMEKARLFGALLAEAVRGQRGVDLRLFGFEHHVIWDVGSAAHCAVHRLQAGGGNNDAAALDHVARVARQARRKARLLVMISDGLPSDCTVNALKALVGRLTRQKFCCAQVAVQAISDVCFPHYVLVEDDDFNAAARKFGRVVVKLVGRALAQA